MALIDSRGWTDLETAICSECVVEPALVAAIRFHAGIDPCGYCKKTPTAPHASAPIALVVELIVDGLKFEYEDPVEQMAWDGGYVGNVHETWDLLSDLEITKRGDVLNALNSSIMINQWCQRDPYAATPADALSLGWEAFRKHVKHRRRFTFLLTDRSTADGAGMLPMHAMPSTIAEAVKVAGLVTDIPVGTEWWRVRPHPSATKYSSAADLGTPPDYVARDNRMTPKGIGAFYGASTVAGARAEVAGYADTGYDGSVGKFITTAALNVVDLRDLPDYPSLFDSDRRHLRAPISFLYGFVKDATKVADPHDVQNLDYVPTQIVAETFRYDLSVDGVLWRSSKDKRVTSCVLFVSSKEVTEEGSETDNTRLVLEPASVGLLRSPL